ncbi:hypothetical protein EON65_50050 [archaeon]|nr:MAG: hypothetical protein EON65_50050 [archaeon]
MSSLHCVYGGLVVFIQNFFLPFSIFKFLFFAVSLLGKIGEEAIALEFFFAGVCLLCVYE